jgi:hypothetical protein
MVFALLRLSEFGLSVFLIVLGSWFIARRLYRRTSERFWVGIGCVALQLGFLTTVTSVFHLLQPGAWLILQSAVLCGILYSATRIGDRAGPVRIGSTLTIPCAATCVAIVGVLLLVLLSGALQASTPISGFDEKMYHASRVIYWIQHHSALPYPSHNDRRYHCLSAANCISYGGPFLPGWNSWAGWCSGSVSHYQS